MNYSSDPCKCRENLNGVYCEVTNCVYHGTGNSCHAENIKVDANNACDKADTCCSTFINAEG